MLTNEAEFEVLLARYEDDPAICSKILRTHSLTDPKIFLSYAQNALLNHPVGRALKFIAGLALSAGLMEQLIEMYPRERGRCMQLAQKTMACDARFDLTFLEFLMRPRPGQGGEENLFHIGLDILDLISQGDRLVPGVLKMLKHHNPKVRSKAALFIGSRTQNVAWAASRTQEYDARVRANILESLYGINSDFAHQIFRNNVSDENNRVAGNAILGLYLLGETGSIPMIHDLARHPDARFRNTGAWIMGRTGDPRFAQNLSELMNDSDELVRAQAFKALGEIRKVLRTIAGRPELHAGIVKISTGPSLITTIFHDTRQPVQGIPGTGFILRGGSPPKVVRQFTVEEYDCRSSLNVAFVLCPPHEEETRANDVFVKAIEACAAMRRSKDRWSILKISPKCRAVRQNAENGTRSEPVLRQRHKWSILHVDVDDSAEVNASPDAHTLDYSNAPARIDAMLREAPLIVGRGVTDDASRVLVNTLLRSDIASGNPHLIFLGAGPEPHLMETLQARGPEIPAVVHVLGRSAAWRSELCRDLPMRTGGFFREVDSWDRVEEICVQTYVALMHHYRISWKDEPADHLELDVRCEHGRASCSYEAQAAVPDALSA